MDWVWLPLGLLGTVFIVAPFAAFFVSAVFVVLYILRRGWMVLSAAALWALYGVYEYGMYLRLLCTGECNIRIDLLLIYPLLLLVSVVAVIVFLMARPPG